MSIARLPIFLAAWRGGLLAAALVIAGCAGPHASIDTTSAALPPAEIVEGCCRETGAYPDWALELADANVEVMRQVGLIQLRRGYMEAVQPARALLESALRPMDLVFFHNDNRMSGHLIPGQFTHGAIYIGTEAQLKAAGLWHLPALAPYRDQIRAGRLYLEAVDGGVRLASGDVVLNTDAVVALRPTGQDRAAALARGMDRMGVPFDMHFDATDSDHLFCAQLISEMFPGAGLPRTPVLDRETILIDGIVAGALAGDLPFALVGYVKADVGGGAAALSAQELAWDIKQGWPASRAR